MTPPTRAMDLAAHLVDALRPTRPPKGPPMADATELTKMTVSLLPAAKAELDEAAQLTGLSHTDTVNRALQVYAHLAREHADGSDLYSRNRDGDYFKVDLDWPRALRTRLEQP